MQAMAARCANLTAEQKAIIRDYAREIIYEDALNNWDYTKFLVDRYVDKLEIADCLDAVCADDEESQRLAFPDFDPETGEPWPDDES